MKLIVSFIAAAALAGCASSTADQDTALGPYAKYSCEQLGLVRGDTFKHSMSNRDLAVLERASNEKGCHIEFR
jgi:hypothetical protein